MKKIPLFLSLNKTLNDYEQCADYYVKSIERFCDLAREMETTVKLTDEPENIMEAPEMKRLLQFFSGDDSDNFRKTWSVEMKVRLPSKNIDDDINFLPVEQEDI